MRRTREQVHAKAQRHFETAEREECLPLFLEAYARTVRDRAVAFSEIWTGASSGVREIMRREQENRETGRIAPDRRLSQNFADLNRTEFFEGDGNENPLPKPHRLLLK